jgi:predicted permease
MECLSNQGKQSVNLILTVLEIVAPVFLLAGLGFAWVRLGFEYRIQFVTRLASSLAVPCLVFTALMQTEVPASALATVSLAALAGYAGIAILSLVLVRLAGLDVRTYLSPLIFGNTGNLGLPLALFAFGEQGLGYALAVFAVTAICSFTLGVWLVSGGGSPRALLREPMVAATLLGALFLWLGWQTPRFLTNTLELIGQMAIPLMLLTLGVAVARLTAVNLGRAVWLSLAKLAICIGVAVAVGNAFGLAPVPMAILVLQLSTPMAVTAYLLAEKYGADSQSVAGLVVVSTLISVLSLPLTLALVI